MRFPILALLSATTLLSGVPLPRAVEPTLTAEDLWFDVVMGSNEPILLPTFVPVQGPDSTVYIAGLGGFCVFRNGVPADRFAPFSGLKENLIIAIGSVGDTNAVDAIFATTWEPSSRPLVLISPGPPPTLLGESSVPAIATTGIRIAVADVDADRMAEAIIGTGPGAPATVSVVPMQPGNNTITFMPFDQAYRGGVFVATGDLNGDGKPDIVVSQQQGSEVKAFEIRGGEAHERGRIRPQGHEYSGGFRVAAGDFNGDGKAEIITGAMSGQPRVRATDVSVPSGRLVADVVVSDRPAEPSQGGVAVAYGRFGNNPHVLVAHHNSVYKVTDPGDPRPKFFSENPFLVIGSVFMDLQAYTPPSTAQR